jgi:ACS family tartrate transporter-like MFS transporter
LERARRKAYWRLLPLLFLCYVIAYVDRTNVSIAKFTMIRELEGFNDAVIGIGFGVFFIGYFILEIPGSLIVERWSARKWIFRIMISWGIMAALTALVKTPAQFYVVRFFLGLAEAGFFPGVIVYLTHWFTSRDRARALAYFFVATPVAQIVSPKISNALLKIGTDETVNGVLVHHPRVLGMAGWQWVYVAWGIPAVVLGVIVWFMLTDKPAQAKWLAPDEREALEQSLAAEKAARKGAGRLTFWQGLMNPKVLLLALAYFCNVTANYGFESFLPSILEQWYSLKIDAITWLVILPPIVALFGQLFVAWSSDRTKERRYHAVIPVIVAAVAMALAPLTQGNLLLTIICFMVAFGGLKAYLPAFWTLPNLFLAEAAAAASIGFINSVGNLGGFVGPSVLGLIKHHTGSFVSGIYCLCGMLVLSAVTIFMLGLGERPGSEPRAGNDRNATRGPRQDPASAR